MLIVFDPKTKKIEYISINTNTTPTCEQVCKYHVPGHNCKACERCITVPDNDDIGMRSYNYEVVNRKIIKLPIMKMTVSVPGQTKMDEIIGQVERSLVKRSDNIKIILSFHDNDMPAKPEGKLVITCTRGTLDMMERRLKGDTSEVIVNWQTPNENTEEKVKFYFTDKTGRQDVVGKKFILIN